MVARTLRHRFFNTFFHPYLSRVYFGVLDIIQGICELFPQRHAYHYEVVAGQHVLMARKELHEEAENGKDSCVCAIYMGVDEVEKRILALHNAKLEGVPYDVLDVVRCQVFLLY